MEHTVMLWMTASILRNGVLVQKLLEMTRTSLSLGRDVCYLQAELTKYWLFLIENLNFTCILSISHLRISIDLCGLCFSECQV